MDAQLTSDTAIRAKDSVLSVVCYHDSLISSFGVWLGDNPLSFALPLLLAQISLIVTLTGVTHIFLRHLGQPRVVSDILAGFALGFSVAMRGKSFANSMFTQRSWIELSIVGEIGLMLFLFMIGVKTDLGMLKKSGKKAAAIGFLCIFLPFGFILLAGYLLRHSLPPAFMNNQFIIVLAATWARSSYTVMSCLLDELNLLNSKLGRLALSASLIGDFTCTVFTTVYTSSQLLATAKNWMMGVGSFLSFLVLLAFIIFVARPLTLWIGRKTPEGSQMDEAYFLVVIMIAFACGLAGELIGYHSTTGAFILGLALPGGHPLGTTLQVKFDAMVTGMFMPVFMATSGFRLDIFSITDSTKVGYLLLLVILGFVGKIAGVVAPCCFCKVPLRDVMALTLMMTSKGVFEVYVFKTWQDAGTVDDQSYAVLMLCALVATVIGTPILKAIYKPSMSYVAYKRRTIQHARRDAELRFIACVHNEENVTPIVELLKATNPTKQSPICIYVLHLVQLIGHAAAMLVPYEKGPSDHATETEHIVNAFRFFEQEGRGAVVVQPFVSISPYATMHDDVCMLALDKKVSLVVLPFHKHRAIDGTMESMNAHRNININVLNYAPCSVAILIDHGTSGGSQFLPVGQLLHHIGVYFFGGPDDREALACAMRLVEHPAIAVTVVRLRQPREWRESSPEEAMDDEIVGEFQLRLVDDKKVMYREEVLKDGEGTIGIIRSMSCYFTLLIVGRRKGVESPLTEGFSMWGEFPELGVVGDVLASTDFGGNVSTLVVQQQARVGADDTSSISCTPAALRARFSRSRRVVPLAIEV